MKSLLVGSLIILLTMVFMFAAVLGQQEVSLDPSAIIQKILEVDAKQRSEIQTVALDAEYIEKESNGKGGFDEKVRLEKKIKMKYLPDTIWYNEEYLRYYKDGEARSAEECDEIAAERQDKKRRRGSRDISWPMLDPFKPENRGNYTLAYQGANDSAVANFVCHHFKVTATTEDENKISGDYYFDAASFQLVKVDFHPAKLGGNILFKMDQLQMSLTYAPTPTGHWLPQHFEISGKGKAAFFIDVDWQGTENFSNPQVNAEMSDEIFKVRQD
ncbi:MAG: hypothetical protein ACREBV_02775 [Candidatus Zixiibacteriota bacterium]